jgi:ankyrin repeat protein
MKMLLEKGVDLNFVSANGELAINEAISNNNIEIAKYLLTQKIQPIALNLYAGKTFVQSSIVRCCGE